MLGGWVAILRVMIDPRGLPELIQYFAYRGSSHRHKGAARHIIDMVWLFRIAYASGEEGGILLVQMIFTCLRDA
jgi:hypothetical protein